MTRLGLPMNANDFRGIEGLPATRGGFWSSSIGTHFDGLLSTPRAMARLLSVRSRTF